MVELEEIVEQIEKEVTIISNFFTSDRPFGQASSSVGQSWRGYLICPRVDELYFARRPVLIREAYRSSRKISPEIFRSIV